MSARHDFLPRTPGCVLLAADLKSVASAVARVWQKPAKQSLKTNMRMPNVRISAPKDNNQRRETRIDERLT